MTGKRSRIVVAVILASVTSLSVAPARADMVGGDPSLCATSAPGTSPAVFDTDGILGPSPSDEPAYITTGFVLQRSDSATRAPLPAEVRHPNEVCFGPESGAVIFEETAPFGKGLWPGLYDQVVIPSINGTFTFDQQDVDNTATGGTFTQTGLQTTNYLLSLQASERASYSRVNVGGGLVTSGGILGWDSEPADGVVDYIGLSWAGMGGFQPCEILPGQKAKSYIDDSYMLWLPVEPHPTVAGAVIIMTDFDCDGIDDGVFPPCPPIIPEVTTPVELSSFTVASARSILPKGVAFLGLAAVVLVPGVRFARRWLPGLDI